MQGRAFTPRSRSQGALTGRRKAPGALAMMEPFLAATYRTPAIIQVNLLFFRAIFFSLRAPSSHGLVAYLRGEAWAICSFCRKAAIAVFPQSPRDKTPQSLHNGLFIVLFLTRCGYFGGL